MFTPTWGNDPIWLIFFKRVETTNQQYISYLRKIADITNHDEYDLPKCIFFLQEVLMEKYVHNMSPLIFCGLG